MYIRNVVKLIWHHVNAIVKSLKYLRWFMFVLFFYLKGTHTAMEQASDEVGIGTVFPGSLQTVSDSVHECVSYSASHQSNPV